jgi:hypothetical protein
LTGKVTESALPVVGASVAVTSGTGAGLRTSTDGDGQYRLYGVAGIVQIHVSKVGYDDLVRSVTVTTNDVLDFPDARQSAGVASLAGAYTLSLTADTGCSTSAFAGTPPLPPELRQTRTYDASLTQNGPSLTMTLGGADLSLGARVFTGRVEPADVVFQIGASYYYSYYRNTELWERTSATTSLAIGGFVVATASPAGISGSLYGAFDAFTLSGTVYRLTGECRASNHLFVLTPQSTSLMRRRR